MARSKREQRRAPPTPPRRKKPRAATKFMNLIATARREVGSKVYVAPHASRLFLNELRSRLPNFNMKSSATTSMLHRFLQAPYVVAKKSITAENLHEVLEDFFAGPQFASLRPTTSITRTRTRTVSSSKMKTPSRSPSCAASSTSSRGVNTELVCSSAASSRSPAAQCPELKKGSIHTRPRAISVRLDASDVFTLDEVLDLFDDDDGKPWVLVQWKDTYVPYGLLPSDLTDHVPWRDANEGEIPQIDNRVAGDRHEMLHTFWIDQVAEIVVSDFGTFARVSWEPTEEPASNVHPSQIHRYFQRKHMTPR